MEEVIKQFEVKIDENHSLKGSEYPISDPKAYIVCITGMNEYSRRYKRFIKALNDDGIYVYFFDHFGQGENITDINDLEKVPHGSWEMEVKAFGSKVKELKETTNLPVYTFGHSMGSFTQQAFLEEFPNVADKTIIMGSNGKNAKLAFSMGAMLTTLRSNDKNWDTFDKGVSNMVLGPYTKAVKNRKTDNDWLSFDCENVKRYNDDELCGAKNTHGFFYEFLHGLSKLFKKKNLKKVSKDSSILIVSGECDPVGANSKGPKSLYKVYKKLGVKDVTLKIYPNMRHEILNEGDGSEPTKDILEFLNK